MKEFKLDDYPKIKPGFTVPDGYFENFPQQVISQIQRQPPKVIAMSSSRTSWVFAAAAVLVLALAIPVLDKISNTSNPIDSTDIDNYIAYAGISNDQIVELLDREDIDKIKIDYQIEDAAIEDALDAENIDNYILN